MTGECASCRCWTHRFDNVEGRGRGVCSDQEPSVLTHEDDGCGAFVDRLTREGRAKADARPAKPA